MVAFFISVVAAVLAALDVPARQSHASGHVGIILTLLEEKIHEKC
ncbi:hypothetical protein [Rhodanobacter umsongensis]